jgi:dipeptidyl aminopeptidase/acylaminoacyl peptidase
MISTMRNLLILLLFAFSTQAYAQQLMTPELLWELGRVSIDDVSSDGSKILFGVTTYNVEENKGTRQLFMLSRSEDGYTAQQLTEAEKSSSNGVLMPGNKIGFLRGGQWMVQIMGGKPTPKTEIDGGISSVKFTPDFKRVMFVREVKTGDELSDIYPDYPKANVHIFDNLMYRHWDHYTDNVHSHVFWADVMDDGSFGPGIDIMENEPYDSPLMPFGGKEEIAWSPDGKTIAYTCKKKTGLEYAVSTNSDIYLYDIETKSTRNLTEGMMGYDKHPRFSSDGKHIAWLSMARDGYEADKNTIYIQDLETGKKLDLAKNYKETIADFAFNPKGTSVYFLSATQATNQFFEIEVPRKIKMVNSPSFRAITIGQHNYGSLHVTGDQIIAERQDMNRANEVYAVNLKDGKSEKLSKVNDAIYRSVKKVKIEKRMIKTTDNKEMLTWVIYPPDFDPQKKYPTLLYCQGGPQSAVSQFYSFRWNFQLMASQGYIIVAPNRRGLPSFGLEWNETISQDWGGQAMRDYLSAIDELAKEPYVDSDNLGAVGASYGGYSVFMLAGIHEGRFSAFISHAGLFNLESWYGTTEELFFANWDIGGPYWEEPVPESYAKFSPHRYIANWDTPILVIHGEKDYRVPISEGMQAFNAAQVKGIPSKLIIYPEENHWILSPQNGLIWHKEYFKWLDQWLKD